jgi:hypothetical protein
MSCAIRQTSYHSITHLRFNADFSSTVKNVIAYIGSSAYCVTRIDGVPFSQAAGGL